MKEKFEKFENDHKNQFISDRQNGPNQPNGAEVCCPFSATQEPLEK
jgi:hypothetical protein